MKRPEERQFDNLILYNRALELYANFLEQPHKEPSISAEERNHTSYWAGRLIGHEQAWDIAKEIIEYANLKGNEEDVTK